jgi:hypothetical protein
MMRQRNPLKLIVLGLVLLLIGSILPFLMVIRLLEPSFLLGFLASASSVIGLAIGVFGLGRYVYSRRRGGD